MSAPLIKPRSVGIWVFGASQAFAAMLISAISGDWFTTSLNLSTTQIGQATIFLGCGEVIATTFALLFSDRIGKRLVSRAAMLLAVPLLLGLMTVGSSAIAGVLLLSIVSLMLELSFVSAIPIFTEINPSSPGESIGRVLMLVTACRAVAAPAAGWIYSAYGMGAIVVCSAVFAVAAVVFLSPRFLNVGETHDAHQPA